MDSLAGNTRKILQPFVKKLEFVKPTWLSYLALLITIGTALCYFLSRSSPEMLLGAVFLSAARLILNILEEAIVIAHTELPLKDQMVRIVPDIYSDAVLMFGIGLSPFCQPLFGMLGLVSVFIINFTGVLGKTIGLELQHQGPLGKKSGLVLIILFTLIQYFRQSVVVLGYQFTITEWLLITFFVLGQWTVINRLRGTFRQIYKLEWMNQEKYEEIDGKILVVYDSQTGNTEKVAEEISHCLNSGVRRIEEVSNFKETEFDLVIIGSPNVNSLPTLKVSNFLKEHPHLKNYAVFITYGFPLWGWLSTRFCFNYFKKVLKRKPLAVFACKAYNPKLKLYHGRPNDNDLSKGFLFGIKIAKLLKSKA